MDFQFTQYISLTLGLMLSLLHISEGVNVNKPLTANWYVYNGAQTASERKNAANYTLLPNLPGCIGVTDECAVLLNESSTHPDFTYVTFDVNGFPNGNKPGHWAFITNDLMD